MPLFLSAFLSELQAAGGLLLSAMQKRSSVLQVKRDRVFPEKRANGDSFISIGTRQVPSVLRTYNDPGRAPGP